MFVAKRSAHEICRGAACYARERIAASVQQIARCNYGLLRKQFVPSAQRTAAHKRCSWLPYLGPGACSVRLSISWLRGGWGKCIKQPITPAGILKPRRLLHVSWISCADACHNAPLLYTCPSAPARATALNSRRERPPLQQTY